MMFVIPRFLRPSDMESRKNESVEQGVAPYSAQSALSGER